METPVEYAPHHFEDDLERVIAVPLSPENINTFADEALNNLIDLSGRVTKDYRHQPTLTSSTERDTEKSAFIYYGLGDIDAQLDHIEAKAEEIRHLDSVIANIAMTSQVIVPPDENGGKIIQNDDGENLDPNDESEQSGLFQTVPRLKTLLFVLENEFDVDVEDPEQIQMVAGPVNDSMVRKSSYVMAKIPSLDKIVLTCDDEGNVTYVLNSSALEKGEISTDDLLDLTKSQMNKMIAQNKQLGRRIIYSKTYVGNMISALASSETTFRNVTDSKAQYLRLETAEIGDYNTNEVIEMFGIHRTTLGKVIKQHSEEIGAIGREVIKGKSRYSFKAEQVDVIRGILEERGVFAEEAPENVLSPVGISEHFDVDYSTIVALIEEYSDEIGPTKQYKFSGNTTTGFEPDHLEIIGSKLQAKGLLAAKAPEGFRSESALIKMLGVSGPAISRVVSENIEQIGSTDTYMFNTKPAVGFSPEQQDLIVEKLKQKGTLAQKAPDLRISLNGMAQAFGVDNGTLKAVYNDNADEIGVVQKYRFGANYTFGFTPHQANFLYDKLEEKGVFAPEAPDDFYSIGGMADELGYSDRKIAKVIGENYEEIGKAGIYKFGAVATKGFSPEQKQLIANKIEEEALSIEVAPPENRSIRGIARDAGVDKSTVARIVESRREEIGETPKHRFGGTKVTNSFSPEQIALINKYLPTKRA